MHFCQKWTISRKWLIVEQSGANVGLEDALGMDMGTLTLNMSRSFGVVRCTFL